MAPTVSDDINSTTEIFADLPDMSHAAARRFADLAQSSMIVRGRFSVCLSGGSTPQELYELLAREPFCSQVPWQLTHLFWGDERLVPPHHEGSNYAQVQRALLDHIPIPDGNVHRMRGEFKAPAAVADYRRELARFAEAGEQWPRFDLVLLGMGSDGHTASLFPGPISSEVDASPVAAVTARYEGRPAQRITLTPLILNQARHVIFLVAGASKAATLAAVRHGPYLPGRYPAQRIRPVGGSLTWFVDEAAAGDMKARRT